MNSKKVVSLSNNDRISKLPEDVLCYILSILPTYEAVSTTILSKPFKNIWRNISNLSFKDSRPPFNCGRFINERPCSTLEIEEFKNVRFADFVNRVLLLHNSHSLDNFYLKILKNTKPYDVNSWTSSAIMKGIQSLHLSIKYDYPMLELPKSLFTCKTLEVLKLIGGSLLINVQTSYCLPKLRKLELEDCEYENDESVRKLISACVSLESLVVNRKWLDNVDIFTIHSPTLRYLEFETRFQYFEDDYEDKLEIDCPALQNLYLGDSSEYYRPFLPKNVFGIESLEVLVLQHGSIIKDAVRTICLPNIKILELIDIDVRANIDVINQMISSCSKSLESLLVHIAMLEGCNNKLVINVPALKILKIKVYGEKSVDFHLESLSSLEEAEIIDITGYGSPSVTSKLCQVLQNVKTLTLSVCQGTTEAICHGAGHAFPMFHRLTVLKLRCELGTLQEFINKSNNLEDLTFEMCLCERDKRGCGGNIPKNYSELHKHGIGWRNPDNVPACLLSSLRMMSIRHCIGSKDDLAMVKYILRNAKVMLTMKIQFAGSLHIQKRKTLSKKILNFRRGQKKCQVLLFNVE